MKSVVPILWNSPQHSHLGISLLKENVVSLGHEPKLVSPERLLTLLRHNPVSVRIPFVLAPSLKESDKEIEFVKSLLQDQPVFVGEIQHLRDLLNERSAQLSLWRLNVASQPIQKAIFYIYEHFPEPALSIKDIAEAAVQSISSLEREFQRAYSQSAWHFVLERRAEEAQRLLKIGISISEVAFAIGFDDFGSFSRFFRQHIGISPSEFQTRFANRSDRIVK